MKRFIVIVGALLLSGTSAYAQETRAAATSSLMGLGMPAQLATQVAGLSTGLGVLSNNTFLKARNGAGTANIDILKLDTSNNLQFDVTSGADYRFSQNGTTTTSFKANGAVFMGFTNPAADLTTAFGTTLGFVIQKNNNTSDAIVNVANAANSTGAHFYGAKTRSATDNDADTIVLNNDEVLALTGYGADGAAYRSVAKLEFGVDGTPGAGDMPGRMVFYTTADGASTLTEALRINSSQNAIFKAAVTSSSTGALGWAPVAGVNTACNTTCTSACVFGIDTAAPQTWLACTDATADMCLCAGAS